MVYTSFSSSLWLCMCVFCVGQQSSSLYGDRLPLLSSSLSAIFRTAHSLQMVRIEQFLPLTVEGRWLDCLVVCSPWCDIGSWLLKTSCLLIWQSDLLSSLCLSLCLCLSICLSVCLSVCVLPLSLLFQCLGVDICTNDVNMSHCSLYYFVFW